MGRVGYAAMMLELAKVMRNDESGQGVYEYEPPPSELPLLKNQSHTLGQFTQVNARRGNWGDEWGA